MLYAYKSTVCNMLQANIYKTFFIKQGEGFIQYILSGRLHNELRYSKINAKFTNPATLPQSSYTAFPPF